MRRVGTSAREAEFLAWNREATLRRLGLEDWLHEIANEAVRVPPERRCHHCGRALGENASVTRRFCTSACSMRAARRRQAGLDEAALPRGRAGSRARPNPDDPYPGANGPLSAS